MFKFSKKSSTSKVSGNSAKASEASNYDAESIMTVDSVAVAKEQAKEQTKAKAQYVHKENMYSRYLANSPRQWG